MWTRSFCKHTQASLFVYLIHFPWQAILQYLDSLTVCWILLHTYQFCYLAHRHWGEGAFWNVVGWGVGGGRGLSRYTKPNVHSSSNFQKWLLRDASKAKLFVIWTGVLDINFRECTRIKMFQTSYNTFATRLSDKGSEKRLHEWIFCQTTCLGVAERAAVRGPSPSLLCNLCQLWYEWH